MPSAVDVGTKLLDEQTKRHIAELTRLRAREKVLVGLLTRWVDRFKTYGDDELEQFLPTPTVALVRDTRKALATLDVPDPKEQT